MLPEELKNLTMPSAEEILTIQTLLYASVVLVAISVLMLAIGLLKDRFGSGKRGGMGRILAFSAGLLGAVWCLRYAVGYFAIVANSDKQFLTKAEEIFNSAVHALQTFSMDEGYTEYIADGKRMLSFLWGANHWTVDAYGIYAAVLNFLSPVVGGAVIFEILASVFPRLRLIFLYLVFWKEKCYFSELNPDSLAMAQSLRQYYPKTLKKPRPVLIFTDTYVDDEKEKDYELLMTAKQMGAICVRDDLLHVSKNLLGKRSYFLMDRQELGNLQTLQNFSESARAWQLWGASIFLMVRSDLYVRVEQQVQNKLKEKIEKKKLWIWKKAPTVIPVQSHRNLVHNLLSDVPLYEPLMHKTDSKELNVTILGDGLIGTEAFLSVYWMGQMMKSPAPDTMESVQLRVDVVSKDADKDFWSKIEYINPEIKKTIKILRQKDKDYGEDIAQIEAREQQEREQILADGLGGGNDPYLTVEYHEADVKSGGFLDLGDEKNAFLKKTDYFIVALGNDEDNITVAERLRLSVGKGHLESFDPNYPEKIARTVIAYAVFDSALCRALNEKRFFDDCVKGVPDIFMHAFGSREQVYSCENVLMSKSLVRAKEIGASYLKTQLGEAYLKDNKTRAANEDKNYTHWADIARALHIKYKAFALNIIHSSIFSEKSEEGYKDHQEKVRQACAQYQRVAIAEDPTKLTEVDQDLRKNVDAKAHLLAWLEHRRWCAFTRTMGYRHTDALAKNVKRFDKHKNMPLKLHPCLVEAVLPGTARKRYILARFDEAGRMEKKSVLPEDAKEKDLLDLLSYRVYEEKRKAFERADAEEGKERKAPNKSDFKEYDYYFHDFDAYWMPAEAAKALRLPKWYILLLCRLGMLKGAFRYEEQKTWFIPCETAPRWRSFVEKLPKPKKKSEKQERETCV